MAVGKKKSRIPFILGVLVLAAILGVALGFVLFQFLMTSGKVTVQYNAAQTVQVSKNTVIIPKKDQENPLDLYTVLLHGEGGESATLVVTDPYGFTFADAEDPLPDGSYTTAISLENGKTVEGPTLQYKAESLGKTEVTILPATEGQLDTGLLPATEETFDKAEMYSRYLKKVNRLMKREGKPAAASAESGAYASGLAYAGLVDFAGDGTEELVVAYYDSECAIPEELASRSSYETTKEGGLRHYHLGVYEYIPATDGQKARLDCVFSGLDAARNLIGDDQVAYYAGFWYEGNGKYKLRFTEVDGQTYLLAGTQEEGFKAFLLGYKAGRFQAVTGMNSTGSTHSIDGMSQSQSACDETRQLWTQSTEDYVFAAASEKDLNVLGTVSQTRKALKEGAAQ